METATLQPEVGTASDLTRFDTTKSEINVTVKLIAALPAIIDAASRKVLYDSLAAGAKMEKMVEVRRLEVTKPLRDRIEALNTYAKESLIAPLNAIIATRKKEIIAWDTEEEKKRQAEIARIRAEEEAKARAIAEEQRIAREKVEAEQRAEREAAEKIRQAEAEKLKGIARVKALALAEEQRIATEAAAAKKKADDEAKAEIDAAIARSDAKGKIEELEAQKSKGAGKRWTYEVEAFDLIPHDLLKLDSGLVTEAIRKGAREIPGIRIFQTDSLALK